MALVYITSETFESEVTKSDIPVIMDFWAEWCGPCKLMGPVFEELSNSEEYAGKLKFAKLDTEAHPELAGMFGIQGIPTLLFLKGGKEVDRIVGFAPKEMLKAKIDEALSRL